MAPISPRVIDYAMHRSRSHAETFRKSCLDKPSRFFAYTVRMEAKISLRHSTLSRIALFLGAVLILVANPVTARAFTFTTIDVPGATSTEASGINERSWVVGHYLDASGAQHGFALLPGPTFITIDVPGATSTEVSGINAEGQIVGNYTDAAGTLHGFVAVP